MEGSGVEILRDSKHGSAFVVNLQKFYEEKTLCDVTLTSSDGVDLEAHWLVLSTHSEFLRHLAVNRDMMQFTMTDSGSLKLNIEATILKTIVDYLYSGDLVVTRQSIDKIKKAAKCLQLARVLEMLDQSHLSTQTSPLPPPQQAPAPPKSTFSPQTKTSPCRRSSNLKSTCPKSDKTISSPQGDRVYLPVPESPVRRRTVPEVTREGGSELKQVSSGGTQTPGRSRDTWQPAILSASSLFGDKSWEDSSNQLNFKTSRDELAAVDTQPEKAKQSDGNSFKSQNAVGMNCTIQYDSSPKAEDITDHVICPSSPHLVHDFKMQSVIVDTLTVSRKRARPSASMSAPSDLRTFEQVPQYMVVNSGEQPPHSVVMDLTGEVCEGEIYHTVIPLSDNDDGDVYIEINSSSVDSCDSGDKEIQGQEDTEYKNTKRKRYELNNSQITGNDSNQIAKNVSQKYSDIRLAQGTLESPIGLATKLFKCILCNKSYKYFTRLQAHFTLKHERVTTLVKELHYRIVSARSVRPIQRQSLRTGNISERAARLRRESTESGLGSLVDVTTAKRSERHVTTSGIESSQDSQETQQESEAVQNEISEQQPVPEDGEQLNTTTSSRDLDSLLNVNFVPKVKKRRRRRRLLFSHPKCGTWRQRQRMMAAAGSADTGETNGSTEVSAETSLISPVSDVLHNQTAENSFQELYSSPNHFIISCNNNNSSIIKDVHPNKVSFKCHICGNPYQSRSALSRHISDKHCRSSHSTLLYKKKRPTFKKRKMLLSLKPDLKTGRYMIPGGVPKIIYLKGKPSCPICRKSFTQRFTVTRHMRDVHFKTSKNEKTRKRSESELPVSAPNIAQVDGVETMDDRVPDEDQEQDNVVGLRYNMEDNTFVPETSSEQESSHKAANITKMSFNRPRSVRFGARGKRQVPNNDVVRQQFELSRDAVTCNVCEKSFSHHVTLLQHVRGFHMNLDNYFCVCGQGFVWSSALSHHRKICPVFNQRNNLP